MNDLNFVIEEDRIYAKNEDKLVCEINFVDGNISHTFVDDSLRGRGIASKLVEMAVCEIKKKGFKPKATCPYALKWLEENK